MEKGRLLEPKSRSDRMPVYGQVLERNPERDLGLYGPQRPAIPIAPLHLREFHRLGMSRWKYPVLECCVRTP